MKTFNFITTKTITTVVGLCCISFNSFAEDSFDKKSPFNNHEKNMTDHIVKLGENLFSLAEKYNLSVDDLKKWNNIIDEDKISLGQKIRLTGSGHPINKNQTNKSATKTNNLTQQAKTALTNKNYSLAVQLLRRLYKQGNKNERQFALEFLGVAREKQGQKAFAKQAYQTFLKSFPQAKMAARVKVRLNNLIGIETLSEDRKLRKKPITKTRSNRSYTRGSISSDYRKSVLINDSGDSRDTLSLANFDVDAKGSYQQDSYNLGFRVSLGHYQDLLPSSNKTSERIRYLNVSAKTDDGLYQIKLGRQRSRGKGVFGRFDGIILGSEISKDMQVNVVAGYPVASSRITKLDPERHFYGLSLDIDNGWQGIDYSIFIFQQAINGLTDRRAVGGEFSYYQDSISVYGLLDYDIFFNALNALLLSGSYSTATQQRYSWSLNYRKSPYVGTRNALIGQTVDSFAELQNLFITDEEILDLALDRTLTSKTASLQFFQPLSKNYDINTSLTWMNISGAPESGGVPAISESGDQYYANIYLSARKLYSQNDTNSFGIRYSSLATTDVMSLYLTNQYRFTKGLSIVSKLRFDDRSNNNGSSQKSISPTFRVQYQSKKHYLYTDLGGIFYDSKSTLQPSQQTKIYFLYLGYRYYF